jgi:agmatine deiminase
MPAEWARHSCCWMLWPHREDNWRLQAKPAQHAFLQVAEAIAQFEPVYMGVPERFFNDAKASFDQEFADKANKPDIHFVVMESNDAWMRDVGPTFVLSSTGGKEKVIAMDWKFNAWGEMYPDYKADDDIARQVSEHAKAFDRIRTDDFILEGGSIHVDGEGTILTTEECLLHSNRNAGLSKQEIENKLLTYLGGEKVIWLRKGLIADEDTNGHIDNICCFSKPGQVLLAWSDDETDEQYAICREAEAVFAKELDAKGRKIEVVRIPIPPRLHYQAEECSGLAVGEDGYTRQPGERMAGSYVNFYIANGGIVCPAFDVETDSVAVQILQSVFPNHRIVQVPGREILLGGGNIHCITQQQPLL